VFERLRRLAHAFLRSECEEAAVRGALSDAAPLYHDAPEAVEAHASSAGIMDQFLREALPGTPEAARTIAGDLIKTTLGAVGKQFSEQPRSPAEIAACADALADMFCAYLKNLAERAGDAGQGLAPTRHQPSPG